MSDLNDVKECILIDGFDYTFIDYSNFEDVNDEKFHVLRKAYVKAHKDLYSYIELHCGPLEE